MTMHQLRKGSLTPIEAGRYQLGICLFIYGHLFYTYTIHPDFVTFEIHFPNKFIDVQYVI